jgi:hypothetical protein
VALLQELLVSKDQSQTAQVITGANSLAQPITPYRVVNSIRHKAIRGEGCLKVLESLLARQLYKVS